MSIADRPGLEWLNSLVAPVRQAAERAWQSLAQAPALTPTLDALQHRFDVFVGAPASERLVPWLALGVFDALTRQWYEPVGALFLSPRAAVLDRWATALAPVGRDLDLGVFAWHEGVGQAQRRAFLADPLHLLLITPLALEGLLVSPLVDKARLFLNLRFVAAADLASLAAGDDGAHLLSLLDRVIPYSRHEVQRLGFAGPVGNPKAVARWFQGSSKRPLSVEAELASPTLDLIEVDRLSATSARQTAASRAAIEENSAIVVSGSAVAAAVKSELTAAGSRRLVVDAADDLPLEIGLEGAPDRILYLAPPGSAQDLRAQLAALGWLDRPKPGRLVFYAADDEQLLVATALANLLGREAVEANRLVERAGYVLVHQILAEALQHQGVPRQRLWQELRRASGFVRIPSPEFNAIVDELVRANTLELTEGLLGIGGAGNKAFDRFVFRDLADVFATPPPLRVATSAGGAADGLSDEIHYLESWFAEAFGGGGGFFLDNQRWVLRDVDFAAGRVVMQPSEGSLRSGWHGRPQLWSRLVAEEVRSLLLADREAAFLWPNAADQLHLLRGTWQPRIAGSRFPLQTVDGGLILPTFAGGRINALLARALGDVLGRPTIVDNVGVFIAATVDSTPTPAEVRQALRSLAQPGTLSGRFLASLVSPLPRGRLASLARYLPADLEGVFFAESVFDVPGTVELLGQITK